MRDNRKTILLLSCGVLLTITVIITIVAVMRKKPESSETYTFVNDAITKTEALENFMIQLNSAAQVTISNQTQRTDTTGYIYADKEADLLYAYVNTKSISSANPEADFDVTVALHSDGTQVYDNSIGKDVPVDMTCEEFEAIVGEYGLYHYEEQNVISVKFNENQMEDFENSGNIMVKLSTPGDKVLTSYAQKMEEIAEEPVDKKDLKVIEADVIYAVYEEMVVSQSYRFGVEYTRTNGETIQYLASSEVTFTDNANQNDYEYIISETEDGTQATKEQKED